MALARMTKLVRTRQFISYFLSVLTQNELSSRFIALKKDTLGLSNYLRFVFQKKKNNNNNNNSLPFTTLFPSEKELDLCYDRQIR